MNQTEAIRKIKSGNWENRARRPGFFQSKQIVVEADCSKTQLTKSVSVHDPSCMLVNNIFIYDLDYGNKIIKNILPRAFKENKNWPIHIVRRLDVAVKQKDRFIGTINKINWAKAAKEKKIKYLGDYVSILIDVQRYYSIAVPLTNYCEKLIRHENESLLEYAVQYHELDIDKMSKSLRRVKKTADVKKRNKLIENHIKKFGWIKTNYNIVGQYTKEDVLSELKHDIHVFKPKKAPEGGYKHMVVGLQIGIYLRNRMKEASQQLWFAYEALAKQLAEDLSLSREDFLQLSYKEIINSINSGKLAVALDDIKSRNHGFFAGILDGREFIFTGKIVDEMYKRFSIAGTEGLTEIKGSVASKGFVKGIVKVVGNISEADKLKQGDILVTGMTTPDFVVVMKRAGAIITDEGGLSCHAAIVSREFRKPCIIGTKIATKTLKDGMRVEVDANKGIIKILR